MPSKKSRITFVVPTSLQKDLRERIVKDGYGLRGKSTWVEEAIKNLLSLDSFPELVNYSDEMQVFERTESIVVTYPLKLLLSDAILKIRKEFPMLEGVQSRIVRTAIIQRLLRK